MRTIEFRYRSHRGLQVPIIPLQLRGRDQWFDLWAFVDSGATYSIFTLRDARDMAIPAERGIQRMVVVGDGSFIPVHFVTLPMKIGEVEFSAEVGFSDRLGVGFNLLGRKGVFDLFRVCFDDARGVVSFQEQA